MPYRRPPRLDGFDYLGPYRYFVTCCAFDRQKLFEDREAVECVRAQIVRTCTDCDFEEIVSVFMPDHIHSLFEGRTDGAAFIPFMKLLRQRSAVAYRKLRDERLWQDGYFEHVLRDEEETPSVVEYVLSNPVRAKLVETPEDYPYSWCKYGLRLVDIIMMRDRSADTSSPGCGTRN
jgi:REP element-mobilizing transposase RayT